MLKKVSLIIAFVTFINAITFAQTDALKQQIEKVISAHKADVGVAVYELESGKSVSVNGTKHFPMQSVFKFHIALCVLHEIDEGKATLDESIFVKKEDLRPNTWSPLRDAYPAGNANIKLSEILGYTVSKSDNNGADILLKWVGGTKVVNDYIHSLGVKDVAIQVNENDMHQDWNAQFKNWSTPIAADELIQKFNTKKILSPKTYDFLIKIMAETTTGQDRIRGHLPKQTIVMHKTGTSDTNKGGITAAINDIGIVVLPNGHHLLISAFVANSKEKPAAMEKIIADISKLAYDAFNK
jgi:beta-lactamase class A